MKRSIRLLLSISSGIVLSLPWLGFPGWLLFVAFLPLLVLDSFFLSERRQFRSISMWSHAFLTFLIWNGLTTWWILHATAVGAFLAVLANSLLMSVVVWLAHLIRRNSSGSMGYLSWIVFWLTFEFFHFHWDIEWPWLTLGNGFANNIRVVQWYEFTGTLGGSLWILIVNMAVFSLLRNYAHFRNLKKIRIQIVVASFLIFLPVIISLIMYSSYKQEGESRRVLIIQPNIDPYTESFDDGSVNDKLQGFINQAESALSADVDYIIGPETVFEQQWEEDLLPMYPAFNQLRQLSHLEGNPGLIIGASTYRIYRDAAATTPTARKSRDGSYTYDVYNTAIFSDVTGNYQLYHKSILVSGVEKMPFRKYLRFLDHLIIDLGGTSGTLGVQPYPTNFEAENGDLLAPVICYESVFGGYLSSFVKKGAEAIVIITNDGWWKNTPGYKQHFSFARLRAVETRRHIARSANTGISGIINQRGDVVVQSEWWKEATIKDDILMNKRLTFYVIYGDYIGRISMFVSALLMIYLLATLLIKTKKIRTNPIA
jgi:apolipoprotein N-acyltransferase